MRLPSSQTVGFVGAGHLPVNPKSFCSSSVTRIVAQGVHSVSQEHSFFLRDYHSNHFRNGESVGRFYGAGGGNNSNGGFKIDNNYSQIQLDCYAGGSTITLEYLSDPNKAEGNFNVHPFSVETVKSWIDWKINANNPNVPAGYSEQKRLLYSRNKKLLFARMSSMSVQDMLQSFRKGNKASPKF